MWSARASALLEAALKATLFSRSTRKVALTPAGEAYFEHARQALAAVASGEERLRDQRQELAGQIRITAPVSWGQRVLALAVRQQACLVTLDQGISMKWATGADEQHLLRLA